jgi:hypothetical protein
MPVPVFPDGLRVLISNVGDPSAIELHGASRFRRNKRSDQQLHKQNLVSCFSWRSLREAKLVTLSLRGFTLAARNPSYE